MSPNTSLTQKARMIEIMDFKPSNKGFLKANFSVKIQKWGGFVIRHMAFFQKGESQWVAFPSKKIESLGDDKYYPTVFFEDKGIQAVFLKKVLGSVQLYMIENDIKL